MRLLTFSFIKNSNLKSLLYRLPRFLTTEATPDVKKVPEEIAKADPSLVEICESWRPDEEVELRKEVLQTMKVFPDFVTEGEESQLMAELEPYLKRMRYEFDHWDNAIQGFRETERSTWLEGNTEVLKRVQRLAFTDTTPQPYIHVLDLARNGHIKPHIDAVRFCGDVIAGLCLCSDAVMRLQHSAHAHIALHALLQRRSLYVMRGVARYSFTHAVLGGEASVWKSKPLLKRRRVALITRSQPKPEDTN